MKKSILMLLSLFMLGACSLVSDDALFLEEVAGKTITVEGTSYTFSSDGKILYSSVLTFEFSSTSSYTVAEYVINLNGESHSIFVTIVDNMISVSEIAKPLFLLAVSEKTVEIDKFILKFSSDGLTTHNNNPAYLYTFKSIVSSTEAKYSNGIYTYIISIDSDGNISAELSDSTTNKEFLDFIKKLVTDLKDGAKLEVDSDYLMSDDGEYIYDADEINKAVYFTFVSASATDFEYDDDGNIINASATYQAMVDGVYLTDVTVEVDKEGASITDYGYEAVTNDGVSDNGKGNFLKAAFQTQVAGETVGSYGFTANGDGIIYNDNGVSTIVSITSAESAYKATYGAVTFIITGKTISID